MKTTILRRTLATALIVGLPIGAVAAQSANAAPGSAFDLSHWKIDLPLDADGDDRPDTVEVGDIDDYSHPDFFYLDDEGRMVFTAPNKAATTPNSTNTRSELRYMLRGTNTRIKTHSAQNNFAVEGRRDSDKFGSVGGRMQATLQVDHVARNAANPDRKPAFSVVIGQIHATKYDDTSAGFGYGNEPIKIYYKKHPDHDYGSLFWTYELNLAKEDPKRRDLAVQVFGNTWENGEDPGAEGIALGEEFSYTINVHRNTMYLTFENERLGRVRQQISLVQGINADDNPLSYGGDTLYFKAGAYNQCSAQDRPGFWYAACGGTGDWETDRANGDYTQVSFSRLVVGDSVAEQLP